MSSYREKPTAFDRYVGKCLKATRIGYGFTLAEVGARTGLAAMCIQSWETGRRACSLETLEVLAAFYGAAVTDFMP